MLSVVILSVVMLSVIMLSVAMLSVVMPSVVMLNVVMLSVGAPNRTLALMNVRRWGYLSAIPSPNHQQECC